MESLNASLSSSSCASAPVGVLTKATPSPIKSAPSKIFELKTNITESELVVLEDVALADARAVILKTTAVMAYRPNHPSERPVTCSLQSLEVFSCVLREAEDTALSIIDPVTLLVELNSSHKPHKRLAVGLLDAKETLPTLEVKPMSST